MSLKDEIMRVFDLLDKQSLRKSALYMNEADYNDIQAWSGNCIDKTHPGYGKPIKDCPHADCIVHSVLAE